MSTTPTPYDFAREFGVDWGMTSETVLDLADRIERYATTARAQAAAEAARDMKEAAMRIDPLDFMNQVMTWGPHGYFEDFPTMQRAERAVASALGRYQQAIRALPLPIPTPPEDDRESLLRDIRTELQRLLDYHGTPHTSERDDFLKLKQIAAALLARLPR
jgi:hypothetical protein